MELKELPYETVYQIVQNLDVRDILELCQTSYQFSQICNDQGLWKYLFMRDYGKNLELYQKFLGLISDWRLAYRIVDSNILLKSPDAISVIRPLKRVIRNLIFHSRMTNENSDVPILDGYDISIKTNRDTGGKLLTMYRKENISSDLYLIGGGVGFIFTIHGHIVNNEWIWDKFKS